MLSDFTSLSDYFYLNPISKDFPEYTDEFYIMIFHFFLYDRSKILVIGI